MQKTKYPTSKQIRKLRKDVGLTQSEAAQLVNAPLRTWQNWETEEGTIPHRKMHPGFWELFKIKVQELKQQRRAEVEKQN